MLLVWLMIVGSLALGSYLWMRIDEAQKVGDGTRGSAAAAKAKQMSADAKRKA